MNKQRKIEVIVNCCFIFSLMGGLLIGMRYFAGVEYAPEYIKLISTVLGILFLSSVLYFIFRFFYWVVSKVFGRRGQAQK